ncbi:unnamed protein product [Polarella glacialis]|uniref:Reverse transcriptase domain-containing protein n=1 Tax=Polarella glacialis TaxID=89957 RepID=A0A813GVC3_POLGL|nr:unnamed protein product [Polarella glacialis]
MSASSASGKRGEPAPLEGPLPKSLLQEFITPINNTLEQHGAELVNVNQRLDDHANKFQAYDARIDEQAARLQDMHRIGVDVSALRARFEATPPVFAARPGSVAAPAPFADSFDFVPSFVELKGWSVFGEDNTKLPYAEAVELAEEVLSRLLPEARSLVSRHRVRNHLNYKVDFLVPGGLDDCLRVRAAIKDALAENPSAKHNRDIYATIQRSPGQAKKVAHVAVAKAALLARVPQGGASFEADWLLGSLHAGPSEDLLGCFRDDAWVWQEAALLRHYPHIDLLSLKTATAEPDVDYEGALMDLQDLVLSATSSFHPALVAVGLDAQTELPPCALPELVGDFATGCWRKHGLRGDAFLEFLSRLSLTAANTCPPDVAHAAPWTHQHWVTKALKQIYFVGVRAPLGFTSQVRHDLDAASDHKPIHCVLRREPLSAVPCRAPRPSKGWQPLDSSSLAHFRNLVLDQTQIAPSGRTECSLLQFEQAVVEACDAVPHSTFASRRHRERPPEPPGIIAARQLLQATLDPLLKHERGRRLRTLRRRWHRQLMAAKRKRDATGDSAHIAVSISVALEARARLNHDKRPGADEVCPEALQALPWTVVLAIALQFETRLNSPWQSDTPSSWLRVYGMCIPKEGRPHRLTQWRVIAVVSFFQKWYTAVLTILLERMALPLKTNSLGFTRGRQTMEAIETLRLLLQKSSEWNLPLAIGSADVLKAFDHMQHDCIEASLWEQQGGTETPRVFARLFDSALAPVLELWDNAGFGFYLSELEITVTHVIWADNVYVIGTSKQMIVDMLAMASMAMRPWGLFWKPSSLSCLANAKAQSMDGRSEMQVPSLDPSTPVLTCPVVAELLVLGVCLDRAGNSQCSVRHRLAAASQLCCRSAPLRSRIERFYCTVVRTLLYGSGGWSPSASVCGLLRSFELRCLRAMLGRRRKPNESYVEWARRSNARLRACLHRWGQLSVCQLFFKSLHGWAGHVCRAPADLDLHHVVRWRTTAWWQALQIVGESDFRNVMGWRHARPGNHTRWETPLFSAFGSDWMATTSSRTLWAATVETFVHFTLGAMEDLHSGKFSFAHFLRRPSTAQRSLVPFAAIPVLMSSEIHFSNTALDARRAPACRRVAFCLDSEVVVHWINGEGRVSEPGCTTLVSQVQDHLAMLQLQGVIMPWSLCGAFLRAIPREANVEADALANAALDLGLGSVSWFSVPSDFADIVFHSDGSSRGNPGPAACAAIISVWADGQWCRAASGSRVLEPTTNTVAELEGSALAFEMLVGVLGRYLVCIGGKSGRSHQSVTEESPQLTDELVGGSADVLDTLTGIWAPLPCRLESPRVYFGAAVVGSSIVVCGGMALGASERGLDRLVSTEILDARELPQLFEPSLTAGGLEMRWRPGPALAIPRSDLSLAGPICGNLYAVGGTIACLAGDGDRTIEVLDAAAMLFQTADELEHSWERRSWVLPESCRNSSAVALNGRLVLIGGSERSVLISTARGTELQRPTGIEWIPTGIDLDSLRLGAKAVAFGSGA